MQQGFQRLQDINSQMKIDREHGFAPDSPILTPREFTSWFGYARRGPVFNQQVREKLVSLGLRTEPDFGDAGADQSISLFDSSITEPPPDATLYVHSLDAANNKPCSLKPDDELSKAITTMASNDYSQMPVMTTPRQLKGIITWKSIGSSARITGDRVRHSMDTSVHVIDGRRPLFEAVDIIAEHGYVLVRGRDSSITGIVTATDLNNQLLQLTEAFLLVGEIESHIRRIIHGRFTREEVVNATHFDKRNAINHIGDLGFGDYCRILEKPELWDRLELQDDRDTFVRQLDEVRLIRNDVMHFNLGRSSVNTIGKLRTLAPFFRSRANYPTDQAPS